MKGEGAIWKRETRAENGGGGQGGTFSRRIPRMTSPPPSASEPSVIVAVVLYNSAEWIGPTLDSIRHCDYRHMQTWVLDNASRDDAADYVAQSYPWARLVRGKTNRGFAGGNNDLIAAAPRSEFVFLVNPDVEIERDCPTELVRAMLADPKLGVAGCLIFGGDGRTIDHAGGALRANALPYHVGQGEPDDGSRRGVVPATYVQGAAMMVRRETWDALGGFDEGFNPAYFEEADFCERARRAGWGVAVVCEARVVHHQDPEKQVRSRNFLRMLFRGRARYVLKHYGPRRLLLRFLPAEIRWLASPASRGLRRIAARSFWEAARGIPFRPESG